MTVPVLLCACFLLGGALAAPAGDEITSLPGLKKEPTFKQYSGYLKASGTKKLHYWFLESQNNPRSDPVVLWLNGGPGCSSDLGLLTEHGPFTVQDDGKTLLDNPFSWNTVSNMLYLEAPAGVGYSYSDDKNYTTNDDITAQDNHLALKDFMAMFPEFRTNEFFITGESYGGVYVPTLSALVVDDNTFNFQGFAVGNGLSSYALNDDSLVYFAYFHGLIGDVLWFNLVETCCHGNSTNCTFSSNAQSSSQCMDYMNAAFQVVYNGGLNIYNLYGPCYKPPSAGSRTVYDPLRQRLTTANFGWAFSQLESVKAERQWMQKLGRVSLTPPCIKAEGAITYMNRKDVRSALHIPDHLPEWQPCSNIKYIKIYQEMSAQYQKILNKGKRVLVYNGDIDMACNFLGDEWFVDRLNRPVVTQRSEWMFKDEMHTQQVAGFFKTFDHLTLVTIRGAGHMVPTDKPRPALEMFVNFISNKPFK